MLKISRTLILILSAVFTAGGMTSCSEKDDREGKDEPEVPVDPDTPDDPDKPDDPADPEGPEIRVLTFEDADWKGSANYLGKADWSSLIDTPQYGGPLLYPNSNVNVYHWYDEGNTELESRLLDTYNDGNYWNGGMAVSDYTETTLAVGDYTCQLSVCCRDGEGNGGYNGSRNFCVSNGYRDLDPSGYAYGNPLPWLRFHDGNARVINSMWVTVTTYFANVWYNGNGLSPKGEGQFKLVAYAFDEKGNEIPDHPELVLADTEEGFLADTWVKWDLSSLGRVARIEFNLESPVGNGYGMSLPAYFAFDDVEVVMEP